MAKTLKTRDSNFSKVYNRIVQQIKSDADFRRVVGSRFYSWSGDDESNDMPPPATGQPTVLLTPKPGNVDWYDPSSHAGTLVIEIELAVMTKVAIDVIDLWDLIVTATQPSHDTFVRELVALGAETGEIVCSDPAYDSTPSSNPDSFFKGTGRMRLTVVRFVSP